MAEKTKKMIQNEDDGRHGTQWTESDFIRNRFYNYLGAANPATIACKELADNCTDQICDGKTNKGYFEIGPDFRSVTAVDGGNGISTNKTIRIDSGKESTYLYLAVAKLYNSTNYGDQSTGDDSTTVGSNGVGSKCNNFLSSFFTAGKIAKHPSKHKVINVHPKEKDVNGAKFTSPEIYNEEIFRANYENPNGAVYGYNFMQGITTIDGVNEQPENEPKWVGINVPLFEGETEPYGYMVHAEYDNSIIGFGDPIDCSWINDYVKARLENTTPKKNDIYFTFRYPVKNTDTDGNESVSMKEVIYIRPNNAEAFSEEHKKEISSGKYVILYSWEDQINKIVSDPSNDGDVFGPYHVGYFDILFAKKPETIKDIQNICQGSIVSNPKSINVGFDVAGTNVKLACPVVWKLSAKRATGLQYQDQTKRKVVSNKTTPKAIHLNILEHQMRKIPELMSYWESEANAKFMKKQGKILQSDFYWPASGGTSARKFFSAPLDKNPEYALELIDRIKDDPDVIAFAESMGYDIEDIREALE